VLEPIEKFIMNRKPKTSMLPEVKTDILSILKEAVAAISDGDMMKLSELSNHTIHNASIFQDEDSISIAVVIYALSKIFGREHGVVDKNILEQLRAASQSLERDNFGRFKDTIHEITKTISSLDSKLKLYIEEVVNQAQIRKGSKIYEHGISLARASEMLGISQWELMSYVDKTQIIDRAEKARKAKNRIIFTRRLFNL